MSGATHRLRADYRAFPSRAFIFQIDNVVGLGDQPGNLHMKRCFPPEINGSGIIRYIFPPPVSDPCLGCCQHANKAARGPKTEMNTV